MAHMHADVDSLPPGDPGDPPFDHLDHCFNSIRETLMCSADVTPAVFQWDPKTQKNWGRVDVEHTCRDWDRIIEWAKEWRLRPKLSKEGHVADDWAGLPARET